ncbi:MAG: iron-sulfur cluster repair di-iron protein [Deltaproteobacteria bacterium HGW-Deltaproteobacteria-14]|jgi:regulator of cell morphogenesis and NO signaling|nr:MAG: iron-sulfur cluster repair di-iron protein [Deltaproteobacteria bacterium HGW-Deltaproteobacteria-14]
MNSLNLLHNGALTVADVARRGVAATRVLQRHKIDFCCGGGRPLDEACEARGVTPEAVLAEVAAEVAEPDETDWTQAPLGALIDHIIARFHDPLREEMPRLAFLAHKVARVHEERDARLPALRDVYLAIANELGPHLDKEEQILFPWIRRGQGGSAGAPVRVMESEHEHVGALLVQLRKLADDYVVPDMACGSWRALLEGLELFEADLHAHIHLENNVLHPRALRGE